MAGATGEGERGRGGSGGARGEEGWSVPATLVAMARHRPHFIRIRQRVERGLGPRD